MYSGLSPESGVFKMSLVCTASTFKCFLLGSYDDESIEMARLGPPPGPMDADPNAAFHTAAH